MVTYILIALSLSLSIFPLYIKLIRKTRPGYQRDSALWLLSLIIASMFLGHVVGIYRGQSLMLDNKSLYTTEIVVTRDGFETTTDTVRVAHLTYHPLVVPPASLKDYYIVQKDTLWYTATFLYTKNNH